MSVGEKETERIIDGFKAMIDALKKIAGKTSSGLPITLHRPFIKTMLLFPAQKV